MKVLVDTNIVLDLLLKRKPFFGHAARLFSFAEESEIEGYLCATTVTTVDYLLGQALPKKKAKDALKKLLNIFEIAPVNRPVLDQALRSDIADFEDAVLEQSALLVGADAITTRNVKDFKKATISVLDPAALISAVEVELEEKIA